MSSNVHQLNCNKAVIWNYVPAKDKQTSQNDIRQPSDSEGERDKRRKWEKKMETESAMNGVYFDLQPTL